MLLPGKTMHQYYEYRTKDGISNIDKKSFKHITRDYFKDYIPDDGNWYVCMQKPFKRHPDFDSMIAGILNKDQDARILLHDEINEENQIIIRNRLRGLNIDMKRVHFIQSQPHHLLMALYNLADVILDSYYAGGCTTTREALEIGGIVVTLPAKYLGGRWSLAYYNIIGVTDTIAKDKEDYVNIAVKIGTNSIEKERLKKLILDNVHKLFYCNNAVESWSTVIENMILSNNKITT